MNVAWFDFPLRLFLKAILCEWWQCCGVKANPQHLPPEIWEKIFQRLPAKSLVKCICVCKIWKSIITNESFILDHLSYRARANDNANGSLFLHYQVVLENPKERSKCFGLPCPPWKSRVRQKSKSGEHLAVHSDDKEANCLAIIPSSSFKHPHLPDLLVVGSCNGLVCFAKCSESFERGGFIIMMNLAIRKYIVLSEPDRSLRMRYNYPWLCVLFGFGFDSKNNDFKVLMLVLDFFKTSSLPPRVKVYSLATGKWRSISYGAVPLFCFCSLGRPTRKLMFVNGALHWIFCGKCNKQHRSYISTFNLAEETFGEIMLPHSWDEDSCFDALLLVRGSCLALAYQKSSADHELTYIVCVMKEYGVVDSWDVLFSVGRTQYPYIVRVMALTSSEKVVLETLFKRVIILDEDMNKETVKDLLLLKKYGAGFAAEHVESLFLINQQNNACDNSQDILDVSFLSSNSNDAMLNSQPSPTGA